MAAEEFDSHNKALTTEHSCWEIGVNRVHDKTVGHIKDTQ